MTRVLLSINIQICEAAQIPAGVVNILPCSSDKAQEIGNRITFLFVAQQLIFDVPQQVQHYAKVSKWLRFPLREAQQWVNCCTPSALLP